MRLPSLSLSVWPKAEADVPFHHSVLTAAQRQQIQMLLRFDNPAFFKAQHHGQNGTAVPRFLYGYERADGVYRLPRHAPWQKLGLRVPRIVIPETEPLPWEFTGTLRDYQEPAFRALRHQLITAKDGILVLSCGKGKTVLACAGFGWLQRPTLAVVTQLFIGEQWRKEFQKMTTIPADRIGMIGDGAAEWDRDVVIATLQTLAQKDFPPEFYRRFGLVFYDETHRLGARHFSTVAPMFTGIRIGLTATLNRSDKMEQLFMLHLGRVFYEDRKQELTPRVYFVTTPVKKDVRGFYWGGHLNLAKLTTHLSRIDYRQEFIYDLMHQAYIKDRKTLVLSDRIEELEALRQRWFASDFTAPDDIGLCIGATPQEERERSLQKPIILATTQLVNEGLDRPDIDTLIITMPRSSAAFCEQAPGRILRRNDEKRTPVVVVLCDAGCYLGSGTKRPLLEKCARMAATFRALGYDIQREPTREVGTS